jgi:hypothetical protein
MKVNLARKLCDTTHSNSSIRNAHDRLIVPLSRWTDVGTNQMELWPLLRGGLCTFDHSLPRYGRWLKTNCSLQLLELLVYLRIPEPHRACAPGCFPVLNKAGGPEDSASALK